VTGKGSFFPSLVSRPPVTCHLFLVIFMFRRVSKSIIFWSYGRTTWQYDVLCVLILAFVFLTPKTWFERGKLACAPAHQIGLETAQPLLIRVTGPSPAEPDAHDIERCARGITERPGLRVKSWRELRSTDGRTVGYEVDIE
jgi:hypothetical protein